MDNAVQWKCQGGHIVHRSRRTCSTCGDEQPEAPVPKLRPRSHLAGAGLAVTVLIAFGIAYALNDGGESSNGPPVTSEQTESDEVSAAAQLPQSWVLGRFLVSGNRLDPR